MGKKITLYDILVDVGMIVMTLSTVYIILDQATNGESSRQLSMRGTHVYGQIRENLRREREFKRDFGRVFWQALGIVGVHSDTFGRYEDSKNEDREDRGDD